MFSEHQGLCIHQPTQTHVSYCPFRNKFLERTTLKAVVNEHVQFRPFDVHLSAIYYASLLLFILFHFQRWYLINH